MDEDKKMSTGCYLNLYESKEVPGMAIALLSDVKGLIMDLDMALNRTNFSLVGKKAFVDYMPAMQGKKVTSEFRRDAFPDSLESIIQRIEIGNKPTKRILLNKDEDDAYNPKRSILTLITDDINEDKAKEELKEIFTQYPILIFPEIDRKENSETKGKVNKVKLYELSEEILRNAYKNQVFEGNHIAQPILLKDKTLARLYGEFGTKVSNALKTSKLRNRTGGENIEEIKKSLNEALENGKLTQDAYTCLVGDYQTLNKKNKELTQNYNNLVKEYNQLQKSESNYKILVTNSTQAEVNLIDKLQEIGNERNALEQKLKEQEAIIKEQNDLIAKAEEGKLNIDDIEQTLLDIGKGERREIKEFGITLISDTATFMDDYENNKDKKY